MNKNQVRLLIETETEFYQLQDPTLFEKELKGSLLGSWKDLSNDQLKLLNHRLRLILRSTT